jgi:signal peptidase I
MQPLQGKYRAGRIAMRRFLATLAMFPVVYVIFENFASLSGVRGTSMSPTLNPQAVRGHPIEGGNDVVLVWRFAPKFDFQRGQVVVLKSPTNPKINTVKRLIAMEGDWVTDKENPNLMVSGVEQLRVRHAEPVWHADQRLCDVPVVL